MNNELICTPVMLPAADIQVTEAGQLFIPRHDPNSKYQIRLSTIPNSPTSYRRECERQHLYLVSAEALKDKDYYIADNGRVYRFDSARAYIGIKKNQIVATTDKSLSLPLIPNSFIERWISEQGKIDKVRVQGSNGPQLKMTGELGQG